MARGDRSRTPRGSGEGGREGPRYRDRDGDHDHDRGEEGGDDPLRHAQIIQRRWLGSPPPTLDRYAQARRQWQQLPGAVVRPGTAVSVKPSAPSDTGRASGGGEDEP
jgi:hypothetical protein